MKIYRQAIHLQIIYSIRLIWVVCLFFIVNNANAQFFNQREIFGHGLLIYTNILDVEGEVYTSGMYLSKGINERPRPYLRNINISKEFTFHLPTNSSRHYFVSNMTLEAIRSKLFQAGLYTRPGSPESGVFLRITDLQVNSDTTFFYQDTNQSIYGSSHIKILADSTIAILTNTQDLYTSYANLIRVDKNGAQIWNRRVSHFLVKVFSASALFQKSNSDIVVCGSNIKTRDIIRPEGGATIKDVKVWQVFYEFDTSGNLKKFYQNPIDSAIGTVCLIPTDDSCYISGGQMKDSVNQGYLHTSAYIAKIDSNYQVVWEKKLSVCNGISHFNRIKKLADGNYLGVGEFVNGDSTLSTGNPIWLVYGGLLVKFDEQGNILWDRKYYAVASFHEFNRLYDFIEQEDGSILACGESTNMYTDSTMKQDSVLQMGWLLRVGADGCLSADDCGYTEIIDVKAEKESFQLSIYPNPFADIINIETYEMKDAKKYYAAITDIEGREVFRNILLTSNSSYQVKTSNLSSGIYSVGIMEGSNKLITQKVLKK
jgi:hypothetical protein